MSGALALMRKDVDLDSGTIRVLHGKGDEARTVGIDPQACAVLAAWMAELRRFHRGSIVCTLKGPVSLQLRVSLTTEPIGHVNFH